MLVRLLALCVFSAAAHAQLTLTGPEGAVNNDNQSGALFGHSVCAQGSLVLIAEQHYTGAYSEQGRVRLYSAGAGFVGNLEAPAPASGEQFGQALAISGGLIAVSNATQTAVHLYEQTGSSWYWSATLNPSSPMPGFGASLAIVGNTVLVGAPSGAGRVAQFTSNGPFWFQGPDILPPNPVIDGGGFGELIAVSGNMVAIAAARTTSTFSEDGAVHLYANSGSGLALVQTLTSPSPTPQQRFGYSIDIDADTVVIGTPNDGGHAWVFVNSAGSWQLESALLHPSGLPQSNFGSYVQLVGNIAAIWNPAPGGAALFRREEGYWSWKLNAAVSTDPWRAIALTSSVLALGDPGQGQAGIVSVYGVSDPPAATTFCAGDGTANACPCAPGAQGHGCANSWPTGGAVLVARGDASMGHDTVFLDAFGTPPNATGLFFQGTAQAGAGNGAQFGDGLRCVAGSAIRLGVKTASGGASTYPGPSDLPVSVKGIVPPGGATRYYQHWYRDVAFYCTPSGFNLTNGVRIAWTP